MEKVTGSTSMLFPQHLQQVSWSSPFLLNPGFLYGSSKFAMVSTFFFCSTIALPIPSRMLSGAAEWHAEVRRGWDLPWGYRRRGSVGLLWYGDWWRRLDSRFDYAVLLNSLFEDSNSLIVCLYCLLYHVCFKFKSVSFYLLGIPEESWWIYWFLPRMERISQRLWRDECRILAW